MGIQGLLPLLKSIQKPCNLKQFAGQTIGVDAYGWLHRGTIACAIELATGKPTTKYVDFAMSRVRMLKHFGITPYLVFDGDYLPSKAKTEKERNARRKESKKLGLELLSIGKSSQAHLELQKSIDVTPEMAGLLIEELKRANVQYIVAPYEADSQMVYLEKKGLIDGILSEDSDLLVFGAKKLLTKLDQYGECVMIRRDDFTACREISLVGWTDKEFRQMAIMSGCDYLDSIEKMGLKTAYRLLRKHKTMDRVIRAIQFDAKMKVPPGYADAFSQAEQTFLHQWVFCPLIEEVIHFAPRDDGTSVDDLPFIGKHVVADVAAGVARGELHPHTKKPIELPNIPRRWPAPMSGRKSGGATETPDLKKHKSIDSFFKPRRTPLAELDVNMFTGTPNQQQMARRASGSSWVATPTTSTPTVSLAQPSSIPASASFAARRSISDSASLRRTSSERAPKRQRLCADASSPVAEKHANRIADGKSKFFGGAARQTAATPSKRSKSGKAATDFSLWSDDSVEHALRDLPMPEGFESMPRAKKVPVFDDSKNAMQAQSLVSTDEAQLTATSATFTQEVSVVTTPHSSPAAEDGDGGSKTPFDTSLKAELAGFATRFAFSGTSSTKVEQLRRSNTVPAQQAKPSKPPSQRGTLTATPRIHVPPVTASTFQVKCSPPLKAPTTTVVPGSDGVEPPSPIDQSKAEIDPMKGSEDLLVSESEAEPSEAGSPRKIRPSLDFGRYAFGA